MLKPPRRVFVDVVLPLRQDLWRSLLQCYRDERQARKALIAAFEVAVLNASTVHITQSLPPGTLSAGSTGMRLRPKATDGIEVLEGEAPAPSHDEVDPWGRSWD